MGYSVMNWKQKLFDETVSRTTIFGVLLIIPLFFKAVPAENVPIYLSISGAIVGGGYIKTIMNGVKARTQNGDAAQTLPKS